tara:strand:- start:6602 stop:7501 length:900 start_codon:yes stop_codon:yes gene_type:complete
MIKHFLDIGHFDKKEIDSIILNAKLIKKNPQKYLNELNDKTLGLLFLKQSNRTRLSFTVGIQKLGGRAIDLDLNSIGFGKRETEEDIIKTLSQYIDCLVIRNNDHKKLLKYASLNCLPIINGLSNYTHPCQTLADFLTIQEKLGTIKNKKISWIGDFNNVARSLIQLQNIYKFELNVILPKQIINKNKESLLKLKKNNILISSDINKNIHNSHCVMTDVWLSMGEKNLKKKNYFKKFQIDDKLMNLMNKKAIFMHCLPANRNEEVTSSVIDGPQSVVWDQAKNRMYVQQAILKYIFDKK